MEIADCGLRIADCGLGIWDLRICGFADLQYEQVGGGGGEGGQEGIHAGFLGVVDVKRSYGHDQGSADSHRPAEETAAHQEHQRNGKCAGHDREEAHRGSTGADDQSPEVKHQVVEWWVDIDGGAGEHRGHVRSGEIHGPPLIPPQCLEVHPEHAKDEGKQCQRREPDKSAALPTPARHRLSPFPQLHGRRIHNSGIITYTLLKSTSVTQLLE